jgi:hypothetical protein
MGKTSELEAGEVLGRGVPRMMRDLPEGQALSARRGSLAGVTSSVRVAVSGAGVRRLWPGRRGRQAMGKMFAENLSERCCRVFHEVSGFR